MPTLEDEIRRLMADETARLHAAPDLVERVTRSSRSKRRNTRIAALAASVAVIVAPVVYLNAGTVASTGTTATATASASAEPEPPAIDDTPAPPSDPPSFGDLGDGRAFGHVKVGYLPDGLQWGHWSVNYGDSYSTSYNHDGDSTGFYMVQIFVYEQGTVQELTDRIQGYRDEEEGEEVTVGGRTGYQVVQNVGEDGMKGTPTLFLKLGESQWAEIMFSPAYVKEFRGADAVEAELTKIAEGLSSTL